MSEKKLNIQALIIIGLMLAAVAVHFIAIDRFQKAPGITTIAVNDETLYVLEEQSIQGYTLNGDKIMEFSFTNKPDSFFFLSGRPGIYHRESRRFVLYDLWFNTQKSFEGNDYINVSAVDDKIFAVRAKEKKIDIFDAAGEFIETLQTKARPYTVFQWQGTLYYSEREHHHIYGLYGDEHFAFDRLPQDGTILQAVDVNGLLHFLFADRDYFSSRYCVYAPHENVYIKETSEKYRLPASLAVFNGYAFVSDNARGIIDVYSPDHKEMCYFGDAEFKAAHERQFGYKKKYLYLGGIMNFIIIILFLWALAVFFINWMRKRRVGHGQAEGLSQKSSVM